MSEVKRITTVGGEKRTGMSSLVDVAGKPLEAKADAATKKSEKRIYLANYKMYCPLCDEDVDLMAKRIRYISVGMSPGRVYVMMCKHLRNHHKQIEPSWFFSSKRKKIREELEPSPIQWYQ